MYYLLAHCHFICSLLDPGQGTKSKDLNTYREQEALERVASSLEL